MALPGQGVVPTGALYTELTAINRRAFVPRLFVQIYFSTPSLFYLIGGALKAAGGLSQITVPVQGQSMVQGQYVGYSGSFNPPSPIAALQDAQFPLAYWCVPVPLPFGEQIIQATDRVISLLKARMNDVWSVTVQRMGTDIFTNNSGNPLLPNSFIDGFDSGANVPIYGGINRNTNPFWGGQTLAAASFVSGTGTVASQGFTRTSASNVVMKITDAAGGESPTACIMNPGDLATLNADFIGAETIFSRPGNEYSIATAVRSGFPNLNVAGVPHYADHFCPKGTAIWFNAKYDNMYMSEDAAFDFSGFYSLVPVGGMGQQGVVVLGWNFVSAKPVSSAIMTGIGGAAFISGSIDDDPTTRKFATPDPMGDLGTFGFRSAAVL